jgi:preprotein translocase subunit Sec63
LLMTESEALKVLELGPEATQEEIRKSYRELVMVWHPDRLPEKSGFRAKAEEKFKLFIINAGSLKHHLVFLFRGHKLRTALLATD